MNLEARLKVKGMTCDHCVMAITGAIQEIDPKADVEIDLDSGNVAVASDRIADEEEIIRIIENEGYEVERARTNL